MFLTTAMALTHLLGCRTPFQVDRHDLEGFRIAALSASGDEPGDPVDVSAAVVVEGRLWHDEPVPLSWYWLDDPDDLADLDPGTGRAPDGEGAHPSLFLPADTRILGVIAESEALYRAFIEIPEVDRAIPTVYIQSREYVVAPRAKTTLNVTFDAPSTSGAHARWMGTTGTFSEIDALNSEWKAPKRTGSATILALVLDDEGRTAWTLADLHVGDPAQGVWTGNRWLPTDLALAPGRYDVVLAPDEAAPSGVRVIEAGPATGTVPECAPTPSEIFTLRWLADGSCVRLDIIDVPITLDVL